MPRTTVDIERMVLKEIKLLQKRDGRALGKIISQLLAESLARRKTGVAPPVALLPWASQDMGALVDLSDKEVLYAIMDRPDGRA